MPLWPLGFAALAVLGACVAGASSVEAQTQTRGSSPAEPAMVAPPSAQRSSTSRQPVLRRGRLAQGGLSFWQTEPGAKVFIDETPVKVDQDGHFVLGFERDHDSDALLRIVFPDGLADERTLQIEDRSFNISRITLKDDSKVNPYTKEQLTQIRKESAAKAEARSKRLATSYWRAGFDWPVKARISSVYGNQRILNGVPKRFHSGTDIAAPEGTPVRAPSTGKVVLAGTGYYFEGGLILIDHGQDLESAMLHLSRVDVKPGQIVSKGEVIGAVGSTGRATGPHLHWTINWKGKPMDAELLLPPMVPLDR